MSGCAASRTFRVSVLSAWSLVEGVRKKPATIRQTRRQILPCIVKEIAPNYLKWIAILGVIVVMMFIEQIDVQLVHAFEVFFVPIGLLAYAISPFADAALYLSVVTVGSSLASKAVRCVMNAYHHEYKGHGSERHWGEMFLEGHAVVIVVLEP